MLIVLQTVLLVLLAVFLTSAWSKQTDWIFTNVLAQIGLGYPFLFLIAFTGPRTPWMIAAGLLVAYWLAFALHPVPPPKREIPPLPGQHKPARVLAQFLRGRGITMPEPGRSDVPYWVTTEAEARKAAGVEGK